MKAERYDSIIIGGGPAGSAAAAALAGAGFRTLLLEKAVMPRMKCCAGGIPRKTAEFLGGDLAAVLGPPIRGLTLSWRSENPRTVRGEAIQGWVVKREEFDLLLLERARRAGAEIREGCPLLDFHDRDGIVRVETPEGVFAGRTLIGADGPRSLVARRLGRAGRLGYGFALETRIRVPDEELDRRTGRLAFDSGAVPGGYGWIFPLGDCLNVGVATRKKRFRGLPGCLRTYLAREGLPAPVAGEVRGAPLAFAFPPFSLPLQRGRCLLAGDAAGLIDRLTGEGIYPALLSGRLAGETAAGYLAGEAELSAYRSQVWRALGANLLAAQLISRLADLFPRQAFDLSSRSDRRVRAAMAVVQGELSYGDLFQKKSRPRP